MAGYINTKSATFWGALATAVMGAGLGVEQGEIETVMQFLRDEHGFQGALLIIASIVVIGVRRKMEETDNRLKEATEKINALIAAIRKD